MCIYGPNNQQTDRRFHIEYTYNDKYVTISKIFYVKRNILSLFHFSTFLWHYKSKRIYMIMILNIIDDPK